MNELSIERKDNELWMHLDGRIDSTNAPKLEEESTAATKDSNDLSIVIDAAKLEYISSAGLRVLLHLRKQNPTLKVINVSPEVYEIFDMTGFNQMMTVEKAYRVVSIEGCDVIGKGANGTLYRIDKDNVVKVYNNADALDDIQHEREVARLALVLGIPTAISYDVVRVGESYGSVFELLNASSFSKILAKEPEKYDWCVQEFVKMLKTIHSTQVPQGKLPDIKETVNNWCNFVKDYIPEEYHNKLMKLVDEVPSDDHMLHGDYHTNNVELQNGEVILIDMDTLAVGNPIFEIASMFNSFVGYGEYDHTIVDNFFGFSYEVAGKFFHDTIKAYLETDDEARVEEVINKSKVIGYTRMIRRSIRRHGLETEEKKAEIELWKKHLLEKLDETDTLLF